MKNEFIPYEQALALKELGFGEPCFGYYSIDRFNLKTPTFNITKPFDHEWCLPAPLYQQAFRWFREKCGLNHFVEPDVDCGPNYYNAYVLCSLVYHGNNYEEAELACLKKLIELSTKTA
jgi:hypothetical protein